MKSEKLASSIVKGPTMVKSIRPALGIATILAAFPPAFGRPPPCPDNIIVQFYADGILQQTFTLDPTDFAYLFFQGTSMAAPHVSGVAALLVSHGVTHPDDVRAAIENSATDMGTPNWDPQYGHGLLNAPAALLYQRPITNDPR